MSSFTGGPGDDVFYASNLSPGDVIDGGGGTNTIVAVGGTDLSLGSIINFQNLEFTPQQFAHGFSIVTVTLSGAEASQPLNLIGSDLTDNLIVYAFPGVPTDLSQLTFSSWALSGYPQSDGIIYNGSGGSARVTINPVGSPYQVNFFGGSNTLVLAAAGAGAPSGVGVSDFQAGAGGDVINLAPYLGGLPSYAAGEDPFAAGFLRLIQGGAGAEIQVDTAGGGQSFVTLLLFYGLNASSLTAANLGGLTSNLAGPVQVGTSGSDVFQGGAGSNQINGGGGVDTVVYTGLLRAYATPVISGNTAVVSGGPEGGTDTLTNIGRIQFADGYFTTAISDPAAQVYRLYEAALDRAPDPEGLANWTHALMQGQSLVSVAAGFVGSLEFQAEYGSLNNPGYVSLLYQNVLGRPADPTGLANWTAALDAGESRAQVLVGFSESSEFIFHTSAAIQQGLWVGDPNAAEVARLYDTVLGRLPDAQGEINWTHVLDSGAETLLQVVQGFVGSPEFQATYGGLNDSQFVQQLYVNALHRTADAVGLANWTAFLAAGHSRAEVVLGFSDSAEHIADTAAHIDQGIWFT